MEAPPNVNPYAPMPGASGAETTPRPPRWLAILVSLFTQPLAGSGLFLLRRSSRDLIWPAASLLLLVAYARAAAGAPRLIMPVLVAMLLLWLVGIVVTAGARAGDFR